MFKKAIRPYLPFTASIIKQLLTYRLNFFMFVLGGFMQTFVSLYLWKAVFENSPTAIMEGFTLNDMLAYIFMSVITARLVSSYVDSAVATEVKDGSIANNLIKPINYHLRHFFEAIGEVLYHAVFVAIPLWIILEIIKHSKGESLDIKLVFLYIISVSMSFVILFLFNFLFGLLAFVVTNVWGIRQLKYSIVSFFSGQLIPLVFFPSWAQNILKLFPFASMNYTPVMIYLEKIKGREVLIAMIIQLIWIVLLILLNSFLWKKVIKKLTILGG